MKKRRMLVFALVLCMLVGVLPLGAAGAAIDQSKVTIKPFQSIEIDGGAEMLGFK